MRKFALIALAGALALSACGKKEEDTSATNNLVEPPVENVFIEEPDAPLTAPGDNASVPEPAAPPTISEQQQIQHDAEATGMTARLDRSADTAMAPGDAANASD